MSKKKKPKDNEDDLSILDDNLENDELRCKHCGGSYVLDDGYDENYCCEICMMADNS